VKQGGPSRDWLNAELGYARNRARSKVRQWFKAQQHAQTVAQGRTMVERELARLGQTALKLDAVAAQAGFDKAEEFFAAFARDDINSKQVQTAIHAVAEPVNARAQTESESEVATRKARRRARAAASSSSVSIGC
jgi:GTP pyrophosphokinase